MQTAINNVINFLTLNWLTGPIFDKELRVSSRRKRNYFVRVAYLSLLAITMVFIWLEQVYCPLYASLFSLFALLLRFFELI